MLSPYLIVLTTLPDRSKAKKISEQILRKRLAACINLIGPIESSFWWQGKIDQAKEQLLLIKTRATYFSRLRRFLEKNHPYSVPEIVAIPIAKGNKSYLEWIKESI